MGVLISMATICVRGTMISREVMSWKSSTARSIAAWSWVMEPVSSPCTIS